jgi:hypothetical protein
VLMVCIVRRIRIIRKLELSDQHLPPVIPLFLL